MLFYQCIECIIYPMPLGLAHQRSDKANIKDKGCEASKQSTSNYHALNDLVMDSLASDIIHLQRTIGNQAVQNLMDHNIGFDFDKARLQPKLKMSNPGDIYEQEAERVAEQVMKMAIPYPIVSSNHKPEVEPDYEEIPQRRRMESKKLGITRKPLIISTPEETDNIANRIDHIHSSGGIPLDTDVKEFMEQRFGYDFGKVRIHTDDTAVYSTNAINSQAYTIGNHIVIGAKNFSIASGEGKRLLAHELTHVVQQSDVHQHQPLDFCPGIMPHLYNISIDTMSSKNSMIFRKPAEPQITEEPSQSTTSPEAAPTEAVKNVSPEIERQIALASAVLRRVHPLPLEEQKRLEQIVGQTPVYKMILERNEKSTLLEQKRQLLAYYENIASAVARGEQLAAGVPPSPEMIEEVSSDIAHLGEDVEMLNRDIQSGLAALGVKDEAELVHTIEVEFPERWVKRAKEIAFALLDQQRDLTVQEQSRYPPNMSTIDTSQLQKADEEMNRLTDELMNLENQASEQNNELQRATDELKNAQSLIKGASEPGGLPGGVPPSTTELHDIEQRINDITKKLDSVNQNIAEKKSELNNQRNVLGSEFPILLVQSYVPGSLFKLSEEDLAHVTGKWTGEILDNIETTRQNINDDVIKVWQLRDIPALTFQSLAVPLDSILGEAVNNYVAGKESDAEQLRIARAVFETAFTIVATVATGPLGGAIVGGIFTAGHVVEDIKGYQAESAASHISLDPVIADISVNEPDLLPMVLDIVALGLDTISVVRALRPAMRALRVTRDIDQFTLQVKRLLPEAADQITSVARRRFAPGFIGGEEALVSTQSMKPVWEPARPFINAETGEITILTRHSPSGEIFQLKYIPLTAEGSITRFKTMQVFRIQGGVIQPSLAGILPPGPISQEIPAIPELLLKAGRPTTLTYKEVIKLPHPERYEAMERYIAEVYGGIPQVRTALQLAPEVAPFPVETPGGRITDVVVSASDQFDLYIEVKTYLRYVGVKGVPSSLNVPRTVPLSAKIREQIAKDVALRNLDRTIDPRWIFTDAPPSQELMNYLDKANIAYIIYKH